MAEYGIGVAKSWPEAGRRHQMAAIACSGPGPEAQRRLAL